MNKVKLFVIYDKNCLHCAELLDTIDEVIKEEKIPCDVNKFLFESPVAINIAIKNDIDDLPGLVVESVGKVCQGSDCSKDKVVKAIKKSWQKISKNQ